MNETEAEAPAPTTTTTTTTTTKTNGKSSDKNGKAPKKGKPSRNVAFPRLNSSDPDAMKKKGPKSGAFASGGKGQQQLKFNGGANLGNESLCANRTILLSVTAVENTTTPTISLFGGIMLVETNGAPSSLAVSFASEGFTTESSKTSFAGSLTYSVSFLFAVLALLAF